MKSAVVVTAAAMLLTSFVGCSKKQAQPSPTAGSTSGSAATAKPSGKITDTLVTYKMMVNEKPDSPIKNDWPVVRELEKRTGVKLDLISVPGASYQEKLNISVATNELADFVMVGAANNATTYGPSGSFLKLNDYIEKFAPVYKKLMDVYPAAKIYTTAGKDSGIYAFAGITPTDPTRYNDTWMARKDLMDELGLKNPNTEEDFYQILKAFKQKYPTSYPLTGSNIGNILSPVSVAFLGMTSSSGANTGNENGIGFNFDKEQYELIINNPAFKDMVNYLNKLMSEGLLDPEFAMNLSFAKTDEKLLTNKSFVKFDPRLRTEEMLNAAKKQDPNTKIDPFAITLWSAKTGKKFVFGSSGASTAWSMALSNKIKNPEIAVKYMDYLYSEDGWVLTNYGIEGESYTKTADGYTVGEKTKDTSTTMAVLMKDYGASYDGVYRRIIAKKLFKDPERYQNRDKLYMQYVIDAPKPFMPAEKVNDLEKQKGANVAKYFTQEVLKLIMKKTPVTDVEIAALKQEYVKFGAQELCDAYNEQYKATYKK